MTASSEDRYPGGVGRLAGRSVARIGCGAMQLGQLKADPDAAVAVVRRALEDGVNHIDTAYSYGAGFVNAVLSRALPKVAGAPR